MGWWIKKKNYLSSKWGVLCTEHPENSSPGSILSASASWAESITSGWCDLKTQWSIWNPFHHSPYSFPKNLVGIKWNQIYLTVMVHGSPHFIPSSWLTCTDLKVHFSHCHLAKIGGPQHKPRYAQGHWGTWHPPTQNRLVLQQTLLLWSPDAGPYQPDRTLRVEQRNKYDVMMKKALLR